MTLPRAQITQQMTKQMTQQMTQAQWRRLQASLGTPACTPPRRSQWISTIFFYALTPAAFAAAYLVLPIEVDRSASSAATRTGETHMKSMTVGAAMAAAAIGAPSVSGQDLLVPSQFSSLSAAVAASQPNDRILIAPGVYPWESVAVNHSLTIESTSGAMATRFEGNGAETGYLLDCAPGAKGSITLRGLHIARGRGIHSTGGGFTLERCLFTANKNGLVLNAVGSLHVHGTVLDCAFVGNGAGGVAQGAGVGIYDDLMSSIDVVSSLFLNNQAGEGGGLHVAATTASVTDCVFAGNVADTYSAGAIARWWGHPAMPVLNSTFFGNSAEWGGSENWNCCVACTNCNFSATVDVTTDCNLNAIPDIAEIRVDPQLDADNNGVLDVCEAPPCPGDLDNSGSVTSVDLEMILTNWGPVGAKSPQSDINGDGIVNAADLTLVLSSWGACP